MNGRFFLASLWNRLQSTYWFLPSLVTLGAVGLGLTFLALDRRFTDLTGGLAWAYSGGAEGARALLSAVAGSIITVVSVTFSVTIVALTVASQHFGPRLLNSFMRDRAAQFVLGTFTGTFVYCLVVLRTVQGGGEDYSRFVPHLAVTGAVFLTLFSVGTLIYYVHHVAMSMQVSQIALAVTRELEGAIDRLYPEPLGDEPDVPIRVPDVPAGAVDITADRSGYVQEIDAGEILGAASELDTVIWIQRRPGEFVVEGCTVATAHPPPADRKQLEHRVRKAFRTGPDRTAFQDAAFSVQQLVEVALRALSPSTNEPFTAMTCIDRLGQGLAKLAARKLPSPLRTDDEGEVRVVAPAAGFEYFLTAAFEPIAVHARGELAVSRRLLETLRLLNGIVRRDEDRRAIERVAGLLRHKRQQQVDPGSGAGPHQLPAPL